MVKNFTMTEELFSAFQGKRVVISGHTGFKGSWLAFILKELGANIFGFSIDTPSNPKHCYYALGIPKISEGSSCITGDVARGSYPDFLHSVSPDFIFHLAAQPIVSKSLGIPFTTFTSNTFGVLNLLEYINKQNVKIPTVIITSDKCYENNGEEKRFSEDDRLGGDDPYSASKAAAEIIFSSYLKSVFRDSMRPIATARAGNVFGGGDWSENRLVPDCIYNAVKWGSITIRMPDAVRPWTYLIDVLLGYLMLARQLAIDPSDYIGAWNFSAAEKYTVMDVVEVIKARLNSFGVYSNLNIIRNLIPDHPYLQLDPTKANKKLNWSSRYDLASSLNMTVDWYIAQQRGISMEIYSKKLIRAYLNL